VIDAAYDTLHAYRLLRRNPRATTDRPLAADLNRPADYFRLGHTKIESTVRYLGIEVDDAIAIAEQVNV
jgi:hypothetical protein